MGMLEQAASELALSRLVDAELVRHACEGSASALRLIVRRYNQRLYRVARAIVRDDTMAEDVMQEAYLSAFRNLAKFRGDASLATWLTRIVVNKATDRRQRADILLPLDALDKIDPEVTAARSQIRHLLERAIDNLPEPFRVVFVMRMVEQLDTRETASALGLREETVKTRLHRAKALMRKQLQPTLASALTDPFPFQDPRCAAFTDALLARLAEEGEPVSRPDQHC
jgi:RNA polymerase sigma-70 factor, ECF subfamily